MKTTWLVCLGLSLGTLGAGMRGHPLVAADLTVPRAPMLEKIYQVFRQAVESNAPVAASEMQALEVLRAAPWPVLDRLARVCSTNVEPGHGVLGRRGNAWRFMEADGQQVLLFDDFSERVVNQDEVAFGLTNYLSELDAMQRALEAKAARQSADRLDSSNVATLEFDSANLVQRAYAAAWVDRTNEARAMLQVALKGKRKRSAIRLAQVARAHATQSYQRLISRIAANASWQAARKELASLLEIYTPVLASKEATSRGRHDHDSADQDSNWCPSRAWLQEYFEQVTRQLEGADQAKAADATAPEALAAGQQAAWYLARFTELSRAGRTEYLHILLSGANRDEADSRVVHLGRPAIPLLIQHLNDRRLTRRPWPAYSSGSDSEPSGLQRVQDVALDCLGAIVGVTFRPEMSGFGLDEQPFSQQPATERETFHAEVQQWWRDYGGQPPMAGLIARLEALPLRYRQFQVDAAERHGLSRAEAIALLKRWASTTPDNDVADLAEELAKRDDFSLRPRLRDLLQAGDASVIRFFLLYGEPDDFRLLRQALARETAAGPSTAAQPFTSQFDQHLQLLPRELHFTSRSTNRLLVPLAVDALEARQLDRSQTVNFRTANAVYGRFWQVSRADNAMVALVALTGHDEGYVLTNPPPLRFAAMDRWLSWWQATGRGDFLSQHPQAQSVLDNPFPPAPVPLPAHLPSMVTVASSILDHPVRYDVPREAALAMVQTNGMLVISAGEQVSFRFASARAERDWFARARPVLPPASAPAEAALEELGQEWLNGPVQDREGRLWFWIHSPEPNRPVRTQVVEGLAQKEVLLQGVGWLACDSRGRLWLRPSVDYGDRLLAWDPATRDWITRRAAPGQALTDADLTARSRLFTDGYHESADGRLFFADRFGVHVLVRNQWSYQPMPRRPNIQDSLRYPPIEFAENRDGVVYAWAPTERSDGGGSPGWWVHTNGTWTAVKLLPAVYLLLPRFGDELWGLNADYQFFVARKKTVITGSAAQQHAFPEWRFEYAKLMTMDPQGATWLLLNGCTNVATGNRTTRLLAVVPRTGTPQIMNAELRSALQPTFLPEPSLAWSPEGIWLSVEGRLEQWTRQGQRRQRIERPAGLENASLAAVDRSGRLYLRDRGKYWRFNPASPLAHVAAVPLLPTMRLDQTEHLWLDALGRAWALWPQGYRTIRPARHDPDGWHVLATTNAWQFEDMRMSPAAWAGTNGAMLFMDDRRRCHLFDDQGCVNTETLGQLVQQHAARVRASQFKALPAGQRAQPADVFLVSDASCNVWWTEPRGDIGVLTRQESVTISRAALGLKKAVWLRAMVPFGNGPRMLLHPDQARAIILELTGNRIATVPDPKAEDTFWKWRASASGDYVADAEGRIWSSTGPDASFAVDANGTLVAQSTGRVLMADRQGGVWFLEDQPNAVRIARQTPDGRRLTFTLPQTPMNCCAAPDGTLWVGNREGLHRFAAVSNTLTRIEHYPVPVGPYDMLQCDVKGRLWLTGIAPNGLNRQTCCYATVLQ